MQNSAHDCMWESKPSDQSLAKQSSKLFGFAVTSATPPLWPPTISPGKPPGAFPRSRYFWIRVTLHIRCVITWAWYENYHLKDFDHSCVTRTLVLTAGRDTVGVLTFWMPKFKRVSRLRIKSYNQNYHITTRNRAIHLEKCVYIVFLNNFGT